MLANMLQRLVQEKHTTVREIAELTGRGESTVYRWINGESQPDFEEVRQLTHRLANAQARRKLAEMFTSGMPVVVEWRDDVDACDERSNGSDPAAALDAGLNALRKVAAVLESERQMIRAERITDEQAVRTIGLIDESIRQLLISKGIVARHRSPRRVR